MVSPRLLARNFLHSHSVRFAINLSPTYIAKSRKHRENRTNTQTATEMQPRCTRRAPAAGGHAWRHERDRRTGPPSGLRGATPPGPVGDIGRELFCLVMKAREAGRDPEMELHPERELRAAARRYRDPMRAWERS